MLRWNKKIKLINDISKYSLLIYVIHENLIVRTYYRPEIWRYIYNKYGYEHILLLVLIQVLGIFIVSLILSILYKRYIEKRVYFICNKVVNHIILKYKRIEKNLLKM